jgi:hypothetical protein
LLDNRSGQHSNQSSEYSLFARTTPQVKVKYRRHAAVSRFLDQWRTMNARVAGSQIPSPTLSLTAPKSPESWFLCLKVRQPDNHHRLCAFVRRGLGRDLELLVETVEIERYGLKMRNYYHAWRISCLTIVIKFPVHIFLVDRIAWRTCRGMADYRADSIAPEWSGYRVEKLEACRIAERPKICQGEDD